jgi:hypothetical protein
MDEIHCGMCSATVYEISRLDDYQVLHCQISALYFRFHLCQHAYRAAVWSAGQHIRDTSAK